MNITRVLVNVGGAIGLSIGLNCSAEPTPPAAPTTLPTAPVKEAAPVRVMSKQAAELLEKAAAAAKAVADVATTMESGNGETTSKGKVVFVLQDAQIPFANWRVEPESASTDNPATISAYDGSTVRVIKPKKKQMTELAVPRFGMPSGDAGSLIPMWFMDQRQDRLSYINLQVVEQVIEDDTGTRKIGDEKVTLVRQTREAKIPAEQAGGVERTFTETVRVALGSDNLARSYEQIIVVSGEDGEKRETRQTYTDLKVNKNPPAETFVLKAPEGFKVRTLDPKGPNLSVDEGQPAIDFALKDAEGKEHKLADLKGKVVLMDFWATWCNPCKQAMPSVQRIHDMYKDKGVVVIGIDTWERKAEAGPAYIKDRGYTYLSLFKGDPLTNEYEIRAIPTMLLIDKEGKIARIITGFSEEKEKDLTKLIDEKLK